MPAWLTEAPVWLWDTSAPGELPVQGSALQLPVGPHLLWHRSQQRHRFVCGTLLFF